MAMHPACVYCLPNGYLRLDQILLRRAHAYLCAPRGQLVEGFLAIAPLHCEGCLRSAGEQVLADVIALQAVVRRFYTAAYGVGHTLFYEQGRAGGGASIDAQGRFPLHAHLCSLPVPVDLQHHLGQRFQSYGLSGLSDLAGRASARPYVFVEQGQQTGPACCRVYLGATAEDDLELGSMRLKPWLARLLGVADRGDWRAWPGDAELAQLIERWHEFHRMAGDEGSVGGS
jgi:hypothetical protein